MNIFMKYDTEIPEFLAFPKFLLETELSYAAQLAYMLLLARAKLSQINRWVDVGRNVFVIYPVEELARDIKKSRSRTFSALKELEEADLIFRKRMIFNGANRIFIKVPQSQN